MPSSLNLNGLRVFRPAVYAEVDASALGGLVASTGNVCVVGSFPAIESNNALTFTSAQDVARFDHSDLELAHIGKVAFSPSLDERIPAGAATLTLLNVTPNTQASLTLNDDSASASLVLKSAVWGPKGNRTQVSVENANTDQVNVTISRDGVVETFEGIESGDVASIYYDGSQLDSVGLSGDRLSGIEYGWTQNQAMSGGSASFDVSDMVSDGALSVSLSTTAHTDEVIVAIVGADLSGASASQTLTFAAGVNTAQTTSAFGRIDSISATSDDTSFSGAVEVDGVLSFDPADFNSLSELIGAIGQLPNVVATYSAGRDYDADQFDAFVDANIDGVAQAVSLRADLAELVEALSSSRLVSVERATGATQSIAQQSSGSLVASLSGGSSSSVTLAEWTSALATIESADIQIIVAWSDLATVHAEIKKHLRLAALAGRERNAWVGSARNETLSQLNVRAKALNDRNIALVGQHLSLVDQRGRVVTRDPMWLALMLACMQAGSHVATPLTRKQPDVADVFGAWNGNLDAAEAIRKGVCSLSFGPLGWRVERSVTTWLRDDNPIYSEVSANESVNASLRDLRAGLDPFVGEPNKGLTANRIKSIVEARLNRQVLDGVIKAFKDVVLEDLGDTLNVGYTVAAVEPLNFIRVTASVARF